MSKTIEDTLARLENELDALINMFAWARKSLENELQSGLGSKQMALTEKDTKKLKELALGMSTAIESKIRWDKAKRDLAKNMTPQEEMAAVIAYIVNLKDEDKQQLRNR